MSEKLHNKHFSIEQLESPMCYFAIFLRLNSIWFWHMQATIYIYIYMCLWMCGCLFVCMHAHVCVLWNGCCAFSFFFFGVFCAWESESFCNIMMLPLTLLQSQREFHLLHSSFLIFMFLGVLHDQPSPGPLTFLFFLWEKIMTEQMLITSSLHMRACDVRPRLPASDCLGGIHCDVFISAGFTGVGVRQQHPFCNIQFNQSQLFISYLTPSSFSLRLYTPWDLICSECFVDIHWKC